MKLQHRSYAKELLDGNDISLADIIQNMVELNTINTLLGGHAITVSGIQQLIGNRTSVMVCEIGCGGGDNLAAIAKWCAKKDISFKGIGIDIKKECIQVAENNPVLLTNTQFITSDYAQVVFGDKPDIVFSSLFCHHFTEDALIDQLQWMKANCTIGFFLNDLQRHPLAYYSIKILTQLLSNSYLVNDAPLSVARGFTKAEWKQILESAHLVNYHIQWRWAFRYLVVFKL